MMKKLRNQRSLRLALACGTAAAALLAPMAALAQESGETTQLEEVRVEQGSPDGDTTGIDPVKGIVAKTSRTGSKTATEINDIPQSVSVVGREQMDMQSPQ